MNLACMHTLTHTDTHKHTHTHTYTTQTHTHNPNTHGNLLFLHIYAQTLHEAHTLTHSLRSTGDCLQPLQPNGRRPLVKLLDQPLTNWH